MVCLRAKTPPRSSSKARLDSPSAPATFRLRSSHCTKRITFAEGSRSCSAARNSSSRVIFDPKRPHSPAGAPPRPSWASSRITCRAVAGALQTGQRASRRTTSSIQELQPRWAQGSKQRSASGMSSKQIGHFISSSSRAVRTVMPKKCTSRAHASSVFIARRAAATARTAFLCSSPASLRTACPALDARQACSARACASCGAPMAGASGGLDLRSSWRRGSGTPAGSAGTASTSARQRWRCLLASSARSSSAARLPAAAPACDR
mmetsp:Transcript_88822/g.231516  ORF Transcript_88822/g.231516 Transcript_88822/m.231516 type:complete len:264 (+) Transcript_88822:373-1164(+)